MIPLSPLHSIEIAEAAQYLLKRPHDRDFSLHTIARKMAPDGRELIHTELVIAGWKTREAFPLAETYPVHILKSYHPLSLHGDPAVEFENARLAAEILDDPAPIGHDAHSLRTCFIPGRPLSRLSPFTNVEPPERCLALAQEAPPALLIGLWNLAEEVFALLEKLHARRFLHGDMELHNVVVCTAPIRPFLIDFETSQPSFRGSDEAWEKRRADDFTQLFRLAVYLQSSLGRQEGAFARAAIAAIPRLFRSPDTFLARLDQADRDTAATS